MIIGSDNSSADSNPSVRWILVDQNRQVGIDHNGSAEIEHLRQDCKRQPPPSTFGAGPLQRPAKSCQIDDEIESRIIGSLPTLMRKLYIVATSCSRIAESRTREWVMSWTES